MDIFNQNFHAPKNSGSLGSIGDVVRINYKNKTITFGKELLKKNEISMQNRGALRFAIVLENNPVTIVINPPEGKIPEKYIYEVKSTASTHFLSSARMNSGELVKKLWKIWGLGDETIKMDVEMLLITTHRDTGTKSFSLIPPQ